MTGAKQERRAFIVLGMHRSGTSALTRVLGYLGVRMPANVLAPTADNPRGFWESRAIVQTHEDLLTTCGSFWHDIVPIPDYWFASAEAARFEELLVRDVNADFGDAALVVIKDPRMCRLLPLWTRVLGRTGFTPTFIISVRDPLEVALSLQRRNGFPLEKGLLLWLAHMQAAELGTRGESRLFVSYEGLLRDWRGVVARICSHVAIRMDISACENDIENYLSVDLRHEVPGDISAEDYGDVGRWARELFEVFQCAEHGGTREIDFAKVAPIYGSMNSTVSLLAPIETYNRGALIDLSFRNDELVNEVKGLSEQITGFQKETARLQEETTRLLGFESQALHYSGLAVHYAERVTAMERSLSWRLTSPLRWVKLTLWHARGSLHRFGRHMLPILLRILRQGFHALPVREASKERLRWFLLSRFPWVFQSLNRVSVDNDCGNPELGAAFALDVPPAESIDVASLVFSGTDSPEVSVIIPVYNNLELTLTCLWSLSRLQTDIPFEVIVVDDQSEETVGAVLAGISGLQCFRNEKNSGFVKTCNRGAANARGRFLAFLNNDTFVQPGWLDELYGTALRERDVGLVGSQLIYPDGTLQEAGGIVWSDGNAWNFGRGQDRRRPEFNFLREADYCSGASILIGRDIFLAVGGFDEAYVPAYYEDTDLAFKVRSRGQRVLYQPLSRVIHMEGATSGTDPNAGVKQHQARNRHVFARKWRSELRDRTHGPMKHIDSHAPIRHRVLVIDSYTPTPDKDSGSVDAFHLLYILHEMGCGVTFIGDDELRLQQRYTADLQRIGVRCEYRPFLENTERFLVESWIEYDIIFLTRFAVAEKYLQLVRRHQPQARVIFVAVDLHFLRRMREAELLDSAEVRREAEMARIRELRVVRESDLSVVKSDVELEVLRTEAPAARVFKLPLIISTPGTRQVGFGDRANFLFVGGFRHPPNVDAIINFAREEWPQIRSAVPEARLLVIGSEAPMEILSLRAEGVEIIGYVRDLAPYLNSSRVMVAPLRYGAGVKGKIGLSLGYRLPCVATPIGTEGMGMTDGREVVTAELGDDFVRSCIRLYRDEELWYEIADAGWEFFHANYSLAAGRAHVSGMLSRAGISVNPGARLSEQKSG